MRDIHGSGMIIAKLRFLLCIKIRAIVYAPFNSEKRKELRKEFRFRILERKEEVNFDKHFDATKIPIYVISYNHLSYLQQMIRQLERYHLKNIHIIDNCSDYAPLLAYLKECPYTVHHMDKNYGHRVLWNSGKFNDVINNSLYVLTDPDIEFNKELPENFMEELYRILVEHPMVAKVGFALAIDDIPGGNALAESIKNESQEHWIRRINDNLEAYIANIDTTFALYRPGYIMRDFYSAIRVAGKFTSKHLPWYSLYEYTEEDKQYIKTSNESSTLSVHLKKEGMNSE